MTTRSWRLAAAAMGFLLIAAAGGAKPLKTPANSLSSGVNWADSPEAPAKARLGQYRVGTVRTAVEVPSRADFAPTGPRFAAAQLPVRLFYPAAAGGNKAVYRHTINLPNAAPYELVERGLAREGAAVLAGGKFPLVVISHGLGGWDTHMSRLCELIASHGYVVAALDHRDMRFTDVPGFFRSMGQVMANRPADQRAAIAALAKLAGTGAGPLSQVDPAQPVGLIGYSMGGYGALGSAGSNYDSAARPFAGMPEAAKSALAAPSPVAGKIGALVLLAPWGGQPDTRVWNEDGVARVKAPVLLIAGDQDTAVNYAEGVKWIFGALKGTERHLLTLHQAGHNIGGNAAELPTGASADLVGYFRDSVWRQERINQIVAHFTIAFLDSTLKSDGAARAYLDVPTAESSQGKWPVPFGEQTGGKLSGPEQPNYWRGFPRDWANGMRLERKAKGE